jgi:hypothetical protein
MNCETDGLLQIQDLSVRRGKFLLDSNQPDGAGGRNPVDHRKDRRGQNHASGSRRRIYEPDRGKVFYRGRPIRKIPVFRETSDISIRITACFPHMTVSPTSLWGSGLRGMPKAEIRDRGAGNGRAV